MKKYKYSGVNFLSTAWDDLKPFDVISKDEYWERYIINHEYTLSKGKEFEHIAHSLRPPVKPNRNLDIIGTTELRYIPLPFKFFDDYMTSWSEDLCYKYSKTCENQDRCDCRHCEPENMKTKVSWNKMLYFKNLLLKNQDWLGATKYRPWAYENFRSIRDDGIAKPINNSGSKFPQGGTHRILWLFMTKNDVPCFFNANPHAKYVQGDNYIIKGFHPYFGDGKYCTLVIDLKLKRVEFYLSFYHSSFDENREEKVGEITYE
jgi:hypothetical protein